MRTRAELKAEAKDIMRSDASCVMGSKNFWVIFLSVILMGLVSGVNAYFQFKGNSSGIQLVCSIVLGPMFLLGLVNVLRVMYEDGDAKFSNIFQVFAIGKNYKIIVINFLYGLIIGIGTLLLIVPGVIFAFMYSQVYRVFNEDPSQGIWECFSKSSALMKGHKFEYFVLQISFILWWLLSIVTLGIAAIYVTPYEHMTNYVFYKELREEQENLEKTTI